MIGIEVEFIPFNKEKGTGLPGYLLGGLDSVIGCDGDKRIGEVRTPPQESVKSAIECAVQLINSIKFCACIQTPDHALGLHFRIDLQNPPQTPIIEAIKEFASKYISPYDSIRREISGYGAKYNVVRSSSTPCPEWRFLPAPFIKAPKTLELIIEGIGMTLKHNNTKYLTILTQLMDSFKCANMYYDKSKFIFLENEFYFKPLKANLPAPAKIKRHKKPYTIASYPVYEDIVKAAKDTMECNKYGFFVAVPYHYPKYHTIATYLASSVINNTADITDINELTYNHYKQLLTQ